MSFHVSDSQYSRYIFPFNCLCNWHHAAMVKQGPVATKHVQFSKTHCAVLGFPAWRKPIHCWSVHHPCNICNTRIKIDSGATPTKWIKSPSLYSPEDKSCVMYFGHRGITNITKPGRNSFFPAICHDCRNSATPSGRLDSFGHVLARP